MTFLVWLSVLLLFAFLTLYIVWSLRGEDRLPMARLRATFFGGVIAFAAVFVAFTWHTLRVKAPRASPPGAALFASNGCTACHSIGHGRVQGPDLAGVGKRYDRDTLIAFIVDPQTVYERQGSRR